MLPAAEEAPALSSGSEEELQGGPSRLLSKGGKYNKTATKKGFFYLVRVKFHQ